jgi:hypothetical protein
MARKLGFSYDGYAQNKAFSQTRTYQPINYPAIQNVFVQKDFMKG